MRINGSREVTVNKANLIQKIKENKANHEKEYLKAVEAYKIEAEKQLKQQSEALAKGSLSIRVNLVAPSNKSEEYDKIVQLFEWDIDDNVTLSQSEFNEYVLDETSFAREAKMLNSTYVNFGN